MTFSEQVFSIVRRIPEGFVASYGDVARMIGQPRKSRFVGFALRNNPEPWVDGKGIPCHRVVFKDGSLANGFVFGGPDIQKDMLRAEKVEFTDEGKVDMSKCRWNGYDFVDDDDMPLGPPPDFDWAAELAED